MSWHAGRFIDPESTQDINDDPFRCSWCRRPFDAARMNELFPPEKKLSEAVWDLQARGWELDELLSSVERIWERRAH